MKHMSIAVALGLVVGGFSQTHAQSISIAAPSGTFADLVNAMEATNQATGQPLYVPPDFTSFLFEWNGVDATDASYTMDYVGPKGGSNTELLFTEIATIAPFQTKSTVDVGFIDNESVDLNRFWVFENNEDGTDPHDPQMLWEYEGQGVDNTPPPDALSLVPNEGVDLPLYLSFYQNDLDVNEDGFLTNSDHFRMFRAVADMDGFSIYYYLLRVADRGPLDDDDYDDGLFLLAGSTLTAVPEPSVIGLGAIGALAGLLILRRRRRSNSR